MGKKYNIVYIDPPWRYKDKAHAGKRGVDYKYNTLSDSEITNLPIGKISTDDSVIFMWATWPRIELALHAMRSWGFTYKTVGFVWCKQNKKADSWFWGMGNWTRANSEICLMGVRGRPKRYSAKIHQLITSRIGRHSAKPSEVRSKIVELCGDLPRIEIFSRAISSDGWDVIGNAIDGQDINEALNQLILQ